MKAIDKFFFELIRVTIGNQVCLSHTPSADEWGELYAMAKKQSLVGVCFAGVHRLKKQQQCPPEMLYLQWMGMAAKIQQRNEVVNRRCVELFDRFRKAGFKACVLKGQGAAKLYGGLSALRQSGDIDLWVKEDRDEVIRWLRSQGVKVGDIDSVHAPADFFSDTEVEVHSRPSYMYNCKTERRLMEFFEKNAELQFANFDESLGFAYPTVAFNLVFSMVHINRHIYSEGIGLRQLMDYYMILMASTVAERRDAYELLKRLNLNRFVAGIMHILHEIFRLNAECSLCAADKIEGEFLLAEMMRGGNFGHYDERNSKLPKSMRWLRGWWTLKRMSRYLMHYPSEVLAIPGWKLRHYVWRKRKGYI